MRARRVVTAPDATNRFLESESKSTTDLEAPGFIRYKKNGANRRRLSICRKYSKKIRMKLKHTSEDPLCVDLAYGTSWYYKKRYCVAMLIGLVLMSILGFTPRHGTKSSTEITFPLEVRIEGKPLFAIQRRFEIPLDFPILIQHDSRNTFNPPAPLGKRALNKGKVPDYGNLTIYMMEEDVARVIYHDYREDKSDFRESMVRDDDMDQYYFFDDDLLRDPVTTYDDDKLKGSGSCRRVKWHRWQFPNCNNFHEMGPAINVPKYLSGGAYRSVFIHNHTFVTQFDNIVWKQIIYEDYEFTYDMYEFVRMDAIVSERLTSNSRIVDIYGHCGLSIFSEYLEDGVIEDLIVPGSGHIKPDKLNDTDDVKPRNTFTATEKLLISLEMAKSIAALHDFPDGRMVHNDIQLGQFLHTKDDEIKLNDFNRAEIMFWDEENYHYCKYRNGPGKGNYRSPEEYYDKPLDEKIDVFSFGNNVYTLLTGLWPFYEDDDDMKSAKKRIKQGIRSFIDSRYKTRSFEESKLVEIIESCWMYQAEDRPSMQEIITKLEDALDSIDNKKEEQK